MTDELVNVHRDVDETFEELIRTDDEIPEAVVENVLELSDKELMDASVVRNTVVHSLDNE